MTTNLIERIPVPGSYGVQPSTNVGLHLQTTGTIALPSIIVELNGTDAILNGAIQTGYSGTIVTDGSGGWLISINPVTNFQNNQTVNVAVQATEDPGAVLFSSQYSFVTIRAIEITTSVSYYEEGDVIEADVWAHEQQTEIPNLVDSIDLKLLRNGHIVGSLLLDNSDRNFQSDGAFRIRFLHPRQIDQQMRYSCAVAIDPQEAPGVGTLLSNGVLRWEPKDQSVTRLAPQAPIRAVEQPRTSVSAYSTISATQQTAAQYEVLDISKSKDRMAEPTILVDLDFQNTDQYLQRLTGALQYVGGGNRLLVGIDDTDQWYRQSSDELPVLLGARMLIEPAATNLLPHSSLDTNEFSLVLSDQTLRGESELLALTEDTNQLHLTLEGRAAYDTTEHTIELRSTKVSITPGQPVLVSCLLRAQLSGPDVTIGNLTLRIQFWNSLNQLVYSVDSTYDMGAFVSNTTFSMLEATVAALSIPGTATKVSFIILTGSWDGGDLMELWMAAPAIQHTTLSTGHIVGVAAPTTREADQLRIMQAGNMNQRSGKIHLNFSPQYDDMPTTAVTLFDTRDQTTLRSGYTAQHRTDGKLELTAVDDVGTITSMITTTSVLWPLGQPVELTAEWNTSYLALRQSDTVLVSSTSAYPQPSTTPQWIAIGQKIDGTESMQAELHRFISYGIV